MSEPGTCSLCGAKLNEKGQCSVIAHAHDTLAQALVEPGTPWLQVLVAHCGGDAPLPLRNQSGAVLAQVREALCASLREVNDAFQEATR